MPGACATRLSGLQTIYNNQTKLAVSASWLVKSPDSHAREPRSRLGGSSWLCYGKIISEFNEILTAHSEGGWTRGRLTMKRPGAVGESRTSGRRGKTPWGKPVSAINIVRKSQAASRWGTWKFRPFTACGAFPLHTRTQTISIPSG